MLNSLLLALAFCWTSYAQATVVVGPRLDWFYGKNYFHNVQGGGGAWIETIDARDTFYFREVARNDAYVELFDATRDMHVRLYANSMYLLASGEAQYRLFYQGHWDDRRLFYYTLPNGQPAYLNMFTSEIWHWVQSGNETLYVREILRNDDQIQVYVGQEGYTLSIMDTQIWKKFDGGVWFKLTDGHW